jgi:hypothetical protein
MEVTKVERKYRLTHHDLVKYQVMTEFVFFRKEVLSDADIDLLTLLALTGPVELTKFCSIVVKQSSTNIEPEDFAVKSQNIRNKISKLEKRGFIKKSDSYKKTIEIQSTVTIQKNGNILLDYKFLAVEPSKA